MPTRSRIQKSIFDPVHGTVALSGAALDLVGSTEFQRLWGIRQTGFAHLVFPGANHTRLEHSLGVYWVASAMAAALELSPDEAQELTLGGLLHDIGHAPFSHTLEPTLREVLGQHHERRGRALVEGRLQLAGAPENVPRVADLLRKHSIDATGVAGLIDPGASFRRGTILQDLLHGAIDADRIDYLQRDAHYTGVAHGAIDAVRLIGTLRQYRGRLAFAGKGRSALEGFLVGRSLMYSSVYYHKTVRAAEVMIQSAVERLPGYPDSAVELLDLTDGDLLCELRRRDERARGVVYELLNRRLFKRVHGLRAFDASSARYWRRLAEAPRRRRETEDRIADRLRIPEGAALLDLAGLDPRADSSSDWDRVTVLDGSRPTYPFRAPSLWHDLAHRSPTIDPVSLYVRAEYRKTPETRIVRAMQDEG